MSELSDELILVTKAEYDTLCPNEQGLIVYLESDWPGSELKGLTNPYLEGTTEHEQWDDGMMRGVLFAQDSEE